MTSKSVDLYEGFHLKSKLQRRIIGPKDFTYRNIIGVLNRYLKGRRRVIDIGCGVGTVSLYIASKGLRVVGLDISSSAIHFARKSTRILGLNAFAQFYKSDFRSTDLKGKFDLVIASEVLEHLPDDQVVLEKLANLVKKGGIVFISVPLKSAPLNRLGLLESFDGRVGHLRRYELEDLRSKIKKTGLRIIYEGYFEGPIRNLLFTNKSLGILNRIIKGVLSDLVTFIDNISLSILGPSQVIIVAKK